MSDIPETVGLSTKKKMKHLYTTVRYYSPTRIDRQFEQPLPHPTPEPMMSPKLRSSELLQSRLEKSHCHRMGQLLASIMSKSCQARGCS